MRLENQGRVTHGAAQAPTPGWGSDVVVDILTQIGVRYVSINPGASLRGLHDSLVNHGGPKLLLCLHEDAAVAVAHGYAKVTGEPMAVGLHANVGVLHGAMGIFNAYCDRVPMIVIGGNGPLDATERRPWIDWIHTVQDLGTLVRNFVKWDDEPASVLSAVESFMKAGSETRRRPCAPVFVCLDRALQEEVVTSPPSIEVDRYSPETPPVPSPEATARAVAMLREAHQPVVLVGRVSRSPEDWRRRVALAETLGAAVICDFKAGAGFPTTHPLHIGSVAGLHLAEDAAAVLGEADVVLALDWIDLGSTLRQFTARTIVASMDSQLHHGWSKVEGAVAPTDVSLYCDPDTAVGALLGALGEGHRDPWHRSAVSLTVPDASDGEVRLVDVISAVRYALGPTKACLVRAPHRGWSHRHWEWEHPLDFLGYDGGGGLGSGPGMVVGAALGLRGTDRYAVGIIGDGDFLQGCTALWTAAHERLPLLIVVADNGTYQTDEAHQELVARQRGRDPSNRHVGQRFTEPRIDIAGIARAQGAVGNGPVTSVADLESVMAAAVAHLRSGEPVVVDVRVAPY